MNIKTKQAADRALLVLLGVGPVVACLSNELPVVVAVVLWAVVAALAAVQIYQSVAMERTSDKPVLVRRTVATVLVIAYLVALAVYHYYKYHS